MKNPGFNEGIATFKDDIWKEVYGKNHRKVKRKKKVTPKKRRKSQKLARRTNR